MSPLDFLIIFTATWRMAYFVAKESGPFQFMDTIRKWNDLGGLLTCVYCASVWTAALMIFLWQFEHLRVIVQVAGASGAAMLTHKYVGADY